MYVDANVWIDWIQQTSSRKDACNDMIRRGREGEIELWTSVLTVVEVHKSKADGADSEERENAFVSFLSSGVVTLVQLDFDIAGKARALLKTATKLRKPNDSIHVASALHWNCGLLYTFDHDNLIPLSGKHSCRDGKVLTICEPPAPSQREIDLNEVENPLPMAALSQGIDGPPG